MTHSTRIRTPWGLSDDGGSIYADGITFYSTPSHGGFKLNRSRNAMVPEYMRADGGWYEEDCAWSIVATVHPVAFATKAGAIEAARKSFRDWYPEAYERFYGVTLAAGESYKRDEELFRAAHVNDFLGIAAWGDWAEGVPAGMVGVCAKIGGRSGNGAEQYFLVPDAEYSARGHGRFSFVIDTERHQAIAPLSGRSTKRVA